MSALVVLQAGLAPETQQYQIVTVRRRHWCYSDGRRDWVFYRMPYPRFPAPVPQPEGAGLRQDR